MKNLPKDIRIVEIELVLPLRQKILRPHKSLSESENPEDRLSTSFHIAAFHHGKIASVGSFYKFSHKDLLAQNPFRLRGMATDTDCRGLGFGSAVLQMGEQVIKNRSGDLLWMHARQNAFPFYQALGFKFSGEFFDQPVSGPHKVMYKYLTES